MARHIVLAEQGSRSVLLHDNGTLTTFDSYLNEGDCAPSGRVGDLDLPFALAMEAISTLQDVVLNRGPFWVINHGDES